MSRNKYPEKTYNLIVDKAYELFLSKGYENTSLNDIIDNLGGMTKGAIYHHFKSKEDILVAVAAKLDREYLSPLSSIKNDTTLSGKQKLEKLHSVCASEPQRTDYVNILPNLHDSPKLLSLYLNRIIKTAKDIICPLIKEGIDDGSINTDYPDELAQMIMLLSDVWLNPAIFTASPREIFNRITLINQAMSPFNIQLFDNETISYLKSNLSD